MTTEQIKIAIDQLERTLFLHSLQPLAIEELEQMQEKVNELKESLLETCFLDISVAELEEMRFKLAEIRYSIIIATKEYLHLNTVDDIRSLENLYRTA
ncbi:MULTISPECIES: hypothetical protein [Bacillales]|uniref:Uncharacterized protein n=2 Tax=Bacillaceae TaxID=186817 RepID=A0A0V8JQ89_9BACI|nr:MULTISPECIES: hypothetical protein [Bacillaceae]KSU89215.1 hypothetical protein AS180_03545 [Priestia veravalensis]NMO75657.1 hypothetical protein [Niallia alba]SCB91913.1 hypothetical protein GA0061087_100433 [Priestia flexa]